MPQAMQHVPVKMWQPPKEMTKMTKMTVLCIMPAVRALKSSVIQNINGWTFSGVPAPLAAVILFASVHSKLDMQLVGVRDRFREY